MAFQESKSPMGTVVVPSLLSLLLLGPGTPDDVVAVVAAGEETNEEALEGFSEANFLTFFCVDRLFFKLQPPKSKLKTVGRI